jgi:hypothetical protein
MDDIKTNLIRIGCEGMDWIKLAQDRVQRQDLVKTVMESPVP